MPENGGRLARAARRLARVVNAIGEIGRGATGADAYANYLEHFAARHPGQNPVSREAFFREDLESRWNGVRRCC